MTRLPVLSDAHIAGTLKRYAFVADPAICRHIRAYISLLLAWNEKISLTTVRDPDEILRLHFGESLFAASTVPIQNGRLADVGSGAGFPGLPLAMTSSGLHVLLVESNLKKAAFLAEAIRVAEISNADVLRARMEEAGPEISGLNFVTARALGDYEQLLAWSRRRLALPGKVVLWMTLPDAARMSRLPAWLWQRPTPIPDSKAKCLLVGSPEQ